jgi:hypothetical protein
MVNSIVAAFGITLVSDFILRNQWLMISRTPVRRANHINS